MKFEWKTCKLGDVVTFNPKETLKKGTMAKKVTMDMLKPFYRDITTFEITEFKCGTKFKNGDTLMARITPCLENGKIAKVSILQDNEIGFGSTEYIVFRAIDGITNDDFVYYLICSPIVRNIAIKSMVGSSGRQRVQNNVLQNLEISIPDLETQKRIGDILSAYDDLIENNQKQIKLLEEMAQRIYKEWFVDLRFPNYENTPVIDGVPKGWETKKLVDIANVIMGQSPKSEFYNKNKEGLPFHQGVGSYGTRFVVDETYSTSFTRIAETGSILFSVRAPVGRLNLTKNKIVIGRGLSAINHKNGYQSYLFYLLKERFFRDNLIGNGSIFASISKNELLGQQFIIPDTKLVKKFDDIAGSIDDKINILDSQIIIAQEIRDRLLPKLMNGEIDVSDIKT